MRTRAVLLAVLIAAGCAKPKDEPATPPEPKSKTVEAEPPPEPELPPHEVFDTAGAAVEHIIAKDKPEVIGFGELHATTEAHTEIEPALPRFNAQILEPLSKHVTDIIVETWPEMGACGKTEQKVSKQVKQDTERPPETENYVLTLANRARELGLVPYSLDMSCKDYESLLDDNEQVDYEKLLLMITDRLGSMTLTLLGRKDKHHVVALYGGSTHNDLYPPEAIADLSYAARVRDAAGGKYVEVDLYVPEFATDNELLAQEPWYPLLERAVTTDKVVLFERGAGSYILLLRKTK